MKRKGIGAMCSILCTSILLGGTTINYARDFFDVEGTLTNNIAFDADKWEDKEGNVNYPVNTESKEWKKFKSHDEIILLLLQKEQENGLYILIIRHHQARK